MEEKDLLGYSQDVLRFEKALEVRYEGYYERLAAQQELSAEEQAVLRAEVTQETETLKEAAASLRQAHQGRRAPGGRACSATPPPTLSSIWRKSGRTASPPASTSTRWP